MKTLKPMIDEIPDEMPPKFYTLNPVKPRTVPRWYLIAAGILIGSGAGLMIALHL